jgi:hypothetical protein
VGGKRKRVNDPLGVEREKTEGGFSLWGSNAGGVVLESSFRDELEADEVGGTPARLGEHSPQGAWRESLARPMVMHRHHPPVRVEEYKPRPSTTSQKKAVSLESTDELARRDILDCWWVSHHGTRLIAICGSPAS